jgi:undecaprenyl-diphosphatase
LHQNVTTDSLTTPDQSLPRVEHDRKRSVLDFPVLDKKPGVLGRRLAVDGHPVWTYGLGILVAFVAVASLSIVAGLVVTHVLLHIHGVAADDESFVRSVARHRSAGLTDASLIGSIIAGGVVLPIVVVVGAVIAGFAKHWRLAGFLLFALVIESGSYRVTTLLIHRHRPEVTRLEGLPVNASYPSGHTAASIAVYCGLALLLTSRMKNRAAQVAIWVAAVLIPIYVAFSRMYRGMHHPIDLAGGVILGVAALSAIVLVTRASGSAAK